MHTLPDGTLVLAATDLANYLACDHLTRQRLGIARGERSAPRPTDDPYAELVSARGDSFEAEQLEHLAIECGGCVDLSTDDYPRTRGDLEAAAAATADAMRAGAPLIYQAHFFDGRWQGRTDFLRRITGPSGLGEHAYEVLDAKLAREIKPRVVHQLSLYNRLLTAVQGFDPGLAHVILGDGTVEPVELRRYAALHRHVVRGFEDVVNGPAAATYPEPVSHCAICALATECRARLVDDDHLSLVAGARRDQREQLVDMGITTVLALASAPEGTDPGTLGTERFQTLHHQADLQVQSRDSGLPTHRHLPPARAAGYALLPAPGPGDVFFDLEGDPFVGDGGIEYLWGWWTAEAGYECVWAHDAASEKAAFEVFIDRICAIRAEHPDMHVFHYAAHELSKLRSLSVQYATREDEVDDLLRNEVLVDLFAVVRQGMQIGEEGYSLKKLERHHGFVRQQTTVREGGGSIIAYETWLETGDDDLLEAIRAYNEEDCMSTLGLRDWILDPMRPEAELEFGVNFADYRRPEDEEVHPPPEWMADVLAKIDELMDGLPPGGDQDTPDQAERRLLAHLLLYHYREDKPTWWRWFDLRGKPLPELVDDRDAIGGLELDTTVAPKPFKQSLDHTYTFPAQEFRLKPGPADDPITEQRGFNVVAVEEDLIVLRRGLREPPPAPIALVDGKVIGTKVLREALVVLADEVLSGSNSHPAARALLRRDPPRLTSGVLGESMADLTSAALGLDHSVLPVQGPPGTGKTFRGAHVIVAALDAGLRVGISAPSHAAVRNLLEDVEKCAQRLGTTFSGAYKGDEYESPHGLIELAKDNDDVLASHQLVAGTAWLFARDEHRDAFDLVFIDEAGQYSLANAVAVGLATSSIVLLGDPQQLPQVTKSDHPDGAGRSVLEHLLGGRSTIAADRGVLLTETWRMHPDVCSFVSERSYDSRLHARPECARRLVQAPKGAITGTGLRALAVEHEGRSQASPEEADAIARACADLLAGTTITDEHGRESDLVASDILVVAPYNLAVRCISDRVPDGVRVGTVDRFQGQQAAVVFYAMTCSAGEDVPRGIDFLFDSHRLNVAVSRAQCLAVLVYSPRLLDADCNSLEAMQLVDGACRFVEMAETIGPA